MNILINLFGEKFLECLDQHSISTNLKGTHKTLLTRVPRYAQGWVGGPEETRTNDYWGAYSRSDQLSYLQG